MHVNCIGLLLAGGFSTRFGGPLSKQLIELNGKSVIIHSLEKMCDVCDFVIIVVNSLIYADVCNLCTENNLTNSSIVVVNDYNCRLHSIYLGMLYAKLIAYNNTKTFIIVHDSARPFVEKRHFETVRENLKNNSNVYVHYCKEITDGLFCNKSELDVDRKDYALLCSPYGIKLDLGLHIYEKYMKKPETRKTWEFLYILKKLKLNFLLLYDNDCYLKKITYFSDINGY